MSGITPNNTTKQIINNAIVKKLNNLETEVNTLEEGVVTVQDDISDVQNDIQDIQGNIETIQGNISDLNGSVTDINAALEGKQSTLTFDNEPRTGSNNPVKSGGIYDALETKLDKESVKFDPEPNGTDALSTGGAYDIVQDLTEQLNDYKRNVVVQTTDADGVKKNLGAIIIDNQNVSETDKAIVVENGGTELKDTDVDGDLTSTTLAVENDATIGGNTTVNGSVTSNEFVGGLEKSISITDENNTTHTFNNTDNVSVSGVLKAQKDINGDSIDQTYVKNALLGNANGVATLDNNGRLPYSQLPESAMELKGLWDASTNTPTLVQGVGTNGDFYIVSVGGTQFGESFNVNDRIIFVSEDNTWHRLPYTVTANVTSVNGYQGAVVLRGTDIQKSSSESTNLSDCLDALQNITNGTFKTALLNFCYPIGSLYWSSNSANPSTLFGGTWTQIKDRFVWAKGDSDTVNATGGAKTVTLAVANLPSHNHTFTGSSVTTSANNRGHTHSYTHTHKYTHHHGYKPSGDISSTSGGSDNKTSGMSANAKGYISFRTMNGNNIMQLKNGNLTYETATGSNYTSMASGSTAFGLNKMSLDVSHTHNAYFTGIADITTGQNTNVTTDQSATVTDGESQNHTHSVTASGTIDYTGSGTAVDKMPPYVVKYCFERIS